MRRLDLSHERLADTKQNGWMLREGAGRVWEKRIRRKTLAIETAKGFAREIATKEEPVILTIRRRHGHVQEERTYPRGYDPGRPIMVMQAAPYVEPSPELPPTVPEEPVSEPEPAQEPTAPPETEPTEPESVPDPEDALQPVSA